MIPLRPRVAHLDELRHQAPNLDMCQFGLRRRGMLIAGAASCVPGGMPESLFAQPRRSFTDKPNASRRVAHVGVLLFGAAPHAGPSESYAPLRQRFRELGYIEREAIEIDFRYGTDSGNSLSTQKTWCAPRSM